MTAIQPTLDDVVEALVSDWRPSRVEARAEIRKAVLAAAQERRGLVHVAAVRRHLPPWVAPALLGASMNRLARRGFIVATGRYEPNQGAAARNGNKPSPVWRLMRPIPEDALA